MSNSFGNTLYKGQRSKKKKTWQSVWFYRNKVVFLPMRISPSKKCWTGSNSCHGMEENKNEGNILFTTRMDNGAYAIFVTDQVI